MLWAVRREGGMQQLDDFSMSTGSNRVFLVCVCPCAYACVWVSGK